MRPDPSQRCDHDRARRDSQWPALAPVGEMHDARLGVHLALANCRNCGTTLSKPLPGHKED
jgi:hypothetical protein